MWELNDSQLKQLAEFLSNLSVVFVGSVIVPLFGGIDKINLIGVTLGLGLAVLSLLVSVYILRRTVK